MAKPLVVTISHELGKEEAKRRLTKGLGYLETRHGHVVQVLENSWSGDRLLFEVGALGQRARGTVDITDDQATLSVSLPMLLAVLAEKARSLIQKEGQLLLGKK
jgi:hypothetical protein